MSTPYGIYNDEGLIEAGLWSKEEAEARMKEAYSDEDEVFIGRCCEVHPEQPHDACEECEKEDETEA